ncbi:MAG: hypothetical protein EPO00_03530, partial [Chloroflexota bacterium]
MTRRLLGRSWAILGFVALVVTGCGSSSATGQPTTPASTSGLSTPAAQATAAPATVAGAPTEAPSTAASGGSSAIPTIVDGSWSKGTIHVDVTGG